MWLSAYHSRDDVLRWNTKEVFGEGLHRRTAAIAGFLVRHATKDELSIHGDFLEQVATAFDHSSLGVSKVASPALWNIPNLLTQGRDARFRPAQRLRKPTVRLYVEPMDNGDLSVIFDLDEKDYVAEGMYDLPYYRRRPINEAFHVTGFYHYMRHATAPTTEAWSAAVAFHILTTLNDGINTLIKDTTEYCHVNLDAELFLEKHDTENRLVHWEVTSREAREQEAAAHELWDIDKRLDGYVSVYGLVGEKLVSYVEGRRALKPQPTYGKIEEGLNVPPDKRGALNAVIREIRKTVDRRKQLAKTLKGSSYHVGERPDQ